jgi:putative ABC transport system permease protein
MPAWLAVFMSRVAALLTGRRLDDDFDREIEAHLAMLVEEHECRGLTHDEALRAARLEFGGPMQTKEERRERRSFPGVANTWQDLRYAARTLRRNPAFAAVVVLTLAIGIGAVTAMFTVVRAVLLRPLPYADPERLIEISEVSPLKGWTHTVVAPANLADWRARNSVFTDIAAYIGADDLGASQYQAFLSSSGDVQPLKGLGTTGNLFDVLGVRPILGRTFTWEETFEGNDRVLVLAYGTWQRLFNADPGVVGRTVTLSGRSMTVIGVMPSGFFFPNRTAQFWTPVGVKPEVFVKMRRAHWMNTVARLRPGVSLSQAREQMTAIAATLERTYPDTNTKMGVRLEPLHGIMAADARPTILMLFGAVAVLFLIVCANVASLQLGRGIGRSRELAVRRALGAARGRLVRQLLVEAFVLSTIGGTLGVALAAITPALLAQLAPTALPLFATPRIDLAVLLFAGSLVLATPLVFGLVPAVMSSRPDRLAERLESASRQTTSARDVLIAGEVGLSVVLVISASLLVRSLIRLQQVDPGFDPNQAITFKVTLPNIRYPKDADQLRAFAEIERQLRMRPGVDAVGATSTLALRGFTYTDDATVEGRGPNEIERELRHESVTPDYFRAMGIRLLAGRLLTERDGKGSNVTLVNDALARQYFPGADPIGKRIKFGLPQDPDPWVTIVGVVADEKQDGMGKVARPEVYEPLAESTQSPMTFVVRSAVDAEAMLTAAREAVRRVDRDLALTDVTTLSDLVRESMGDERFRTLLLSGFAGVALFLAALGIYGVVAYFVTQRTRELGIRLALGARPAALFRMVIAQGTRSVTIGAVAGLVAALGIAGMMRSLLFGITPLDPATYVVAIAVLVVIALIACAIPATRATHVDPVVALRAE